MIESQRHRETLCETERMRRQDARLYRDVDGDAVAAEYATAQADALTYALRAMEERDRMRAAIQRVLGDITINVHIDARRWLHDALKEGSADVRKG